MRNIFKFSLLALMAVGFIWIEGNAGTITLVPGGGGTPPGMSFMTMTSSGQVFQRGGTLYAVLASTGATGDWFDLFDTAAVAVGGSAFASFASTQTVCPQVFFSSVAAASAFTEPYTERLNWYPYGVRISNGLYFYAPAGNNNGDKVTVYYYK